MARKRNSFGKTIRKPVPFRESFESISRAGDFSRAALLLALGGLLLRENEAFSDEILTTAPSALPSVPPNVMDYRHYVRHHPLPSISPLDSPLPTAESLDVAGRELVDGLYGDSVEEAGVSAVRLIACFARHPNPLLRACAAATAYDIDLQRENAVLVMWSALQEAQDEDSQAICLSALACRTDNFARGLDINPISTTAQPDMADSLLIHGTCFAWHGHQVDEWWKPESGKFHQHIKRGIRPNVYEQPDYFRWSGGWNDYARAKAARELVEWLNRRGLRTPDVFAHSHGGNVALIASHRERMRNLILLSCPVHSDLSVPSFSNVQRILSIRIHWDLVIMADKGRQHFRDSRIQEKVLPIWFIGHGATVSPRTWTANRLDEFVRRHGVS